jgi:hypothetical protein
MLEKEFLIFCSQFSLFSFLFGVDFYMNHQLYFTKPRKLSQIPVVFTHISPFPYRLRTSPALHIHSPITHRRLHLTQMPPTRLNSRRSYLSRAF